MDDRTTEPSPASPGAEDRLPPADEIAAAHDAQSHAPDAVQTLRDAMRRARSDDAERTSALADLRASRIARLEILQDALDPLVTQIPKDCDFVDIALMPGPSPRLFIDMIGFIEMGRDARSYHFLQDTRHGRVKIAESADVETMVGAVTDYVARRLLERDKALAADRPAAPIAAPARSPPRGTPEPRSPEPRRNPEPPLGRPQPRDPRPVAARDIAEPRSGRAGLFRWTSIGFAFLIDLLGSIALFTLLAGLAWVLYNRLRGQV